MRWRLNLNQILYISQCARKGREESERDITPFFSESVYLLARTKTEESGGGIPALACLQL